VKIGEGWELRHALRHLRSIILAKSRLNKLYIFFSRFSLAKNSRTTYLTVLTVPMLLSFQSIAQKPCFFSDSKLKSLDVKQLSTAECPITHQDWSVIVCDTNARD
jgi:hypothetical protein